MTNEIGTNQKNKKLVWSFWQELGEADELASQSVTKKYLHRDCVWRGPDPLNTLTGSEAFAANFWTPLTRSLSNLERTTHIFMGGKSNGRVDGMQDGNMWVGGTGVFTGTFSSDYLEIPASGTQVTLRWGEFCKVEDGKITEIYCLLDFIDLMHQVGIDVLPASRGIDGMYPPPYACDGVMLEAQDQAVSDHSLKHIRGFIFDGLNSYDQSDLSSMGMADYFNSELKWYGPGGIGACLSFSRFEKYHQQPWLIAYPDRQVQNLDALFAEGPYSGGPGWAGVVARHTGPYLDCPPTNKSVEFNGIDFWKLEGDQYTENWVFVDMIHLFRQFGVDLMARMKSLVK